MIIKNLIHLTYYLYKIIFEIQCIQFQQNTNIFKIIFYSFPFDGKGNILAHAFYPTEQGSLGGDIHFDNSEDWTIDNSNSAGI